MDEHRAFLQSILDDPDDDAPRLVYADWLEERGDPRAEFIRAQCALAQLPDGDDLRPDLEATEARLLARHGKGWAGPLRRWVKGWAFRRGFVEGVTLRAETFLARGEELFRLAPIRHARLLGAAGRIDALASSPLLARLTSLDLGDNFVMGPDEAPRRGADRSSWRGHWQRFQAARQAAQAAGAGHLRRLLASPHLAGLRELHLENNRLGGPGIRALVESGILERLTTLDLRRNHMGIDEVRALVASKRLGRLRTLRLAFCHNREPGFNDHDRRYSRPPAGYTNYDEEEQWVYGPGGNYYAQGPIARIVAPLTSRLSELELGACELTHVGIQDFKARPKALTRLSLHHNFIGLPGARALAASPVADRLTSLDLGSGYIDGRALAVLAGAPRLARLTALDLHNHDLGEDGVGALLDATFAGRLARLGLAGSHPTYTDFDPDKQIGNAGVRLLAEGADRLPRLVRLDLRKNGLTAAIAVALAASPLLERLAWLDLRHNRLGDAGAHFFAAVGPWPRLARLDLRDNGITPAAGRVLRERFGSLVLDASPPPPRGARA